MPSPLLSCAKTMRACEAARYEGAPAFQPKVSKFVPAHRRYTPELIASGRVRYEQTQESVAAIAADFDMLPCSFRRMARRFNWVRHGTAPRRLPEATRLHAEAQALENLLMPPEPEPAPEPEPETPLSAIDRLERAVMAELASVERMRRHLGKYPMHGREAMRTARTLATLTDTLSKLHRLRCTTAGEGESDRPDDKAVDKPDVTPAEELDQFRQELARRVAALNKEYEEEQQAQNDALTNALRPD